jgi:hypothetical protein
MKAATVIALFVLAAPLACERARPASPAAPATRSRAVTTELHGLLDACIEAVWARARNVLRHDLCEASGKSIEACFRDLPPPAEPYMACDAERSDLRAACDAGDLRACVALHFNPEASGEEQDSDGTALLTACRGGEWAGCLLVADQDPSPARREAVERFGDACRGGGEDVCVDYVGHHPSGQPADRHALLRAACDRGSALSCAVLGLELFEVDPAGAHAAFVAACTGGVEDACAIGPDRPIEASLRARCQHDEPSACFDLALHVAGDAEGDVQAVRLLESICWRADSTMRGVPLGCTEPDRDTRGHADHALVPYCDACAAGHAWACDVQPLAERRLAAQRAACEKTLDERCPHGCDPREGRFAGRDPCVDAAALLRGGCGTAADDDAAMAAYRRACTESGSCWALEEVYADRRFHHVAPLTHPAPVGETVAGPDAAAMVSVPPVVLAGGRILAFHSPSDSGDGSIDDHRVLSAEGRSRRVDERQARRLLAAGPVRLMVRLPSASQLERGEAGGRLVDASDEHLLVVREAGPGPVRWSAPYTRQRVVSADAPSTDPCRTQMLVHREMWIDPPTGLLLAVLEYSAHHCFNTRLYAVATVRDD